MESTSSVTQGSGSSSDCPPVAFKYRGSIKSNHLTGPKGNVSEDNRIPISSEKFNRLWTAGLGVNAQRDFQMDHVSEVIGLASLLSETFTESNVWMKLVTVLGKFPLIKLFLNQVQRELDKSLYTMLWMSHSHTHAVLVEKGMMQGSVLVNLRNFEVLQDIYFQIPMELSCLSWNCRDCPVSKQGRSALRWDFRGFLLRMS